MIQSVTAIIVTHNSEEVLGLCLEKIRMQTKSVEEIIIVDSGSENKAYLENIMDCGKLRIYLEDNIGFARANNRGYRERRSDSEYVLFLNPDVFLHHEFIEKSLEIMGRLSPVGIVSGRLTGFDISKKMGTGSLDSTGIFRKFYGRWYDRGQNEKDQGQYAVDEEVPALCGALLFCREKALRDFNGEIFDTDFFLYKEDIELSLRMRKNGWKMLYSSALKAFHCRGWSRRANVPYTLRKIAAESEITLYKKHPSPYIIWAYIKYFAVIFFHL